MDRSSGLKECPRCGLRNRGGAYQCDFCGWDFKAVSDDWMGQLNDLEKIGREMTPIDIDSVTRSKIEMTMKKPSDIPVKEVKADKGLDVAPQLALEDHGDVMAVPVASEIAETELEPLPLSGEETSLAVEETAAPQVEVATEQMSMPVDEDEEEEAVHSSRLSSLPHLIPAALLAMGLAVYVLDIYVISSGILSGAVAWGLSIVASLLMVYAVIRYLPMLVGHRDDENEAVLCPVCHELVSDEDPRCPSCGVRFKESVAGE